MRTFWGSSDDESFEASRNSQAGPARHEERGLQMEPAVVPGSSAAAGQQGLRVGHIMTVNQV